MALFFISGVSGSGKSAVGLELRSRGYETYDTDDDGLAKWQNKETGYIHPKSSVKKEARTKEFLSAHSWNIPRQEVEQLAIKAKDKTIFICGVAHNEEQLWDLFSKVFELLINENTLIHRLKTRESNDWGKQPHELEYTLNALKNVDKLYKYSDRIVIDASQPLNKVVDDILSVIY